MGKIDALSAYHWIKNPVLYKIKKSIHSILFLSVILLFSGCMGKYTGDPLKAYKYWSNETPPKEVRVIHGKYSESANWTKEYEMYLEIKATSSWINEYIIQNHLVKKNDSLSIPQNAPKWFKATDKAISYRQSDVNNNSVYYVDSIESRLFIYEIQL